MKVILFVGSVRPGRMADRVAALVRNYLSQFGDIEVITFDPLEKTYLAEVKEPVHFTGNPPDCLVEDQRTIESADGYVIVCAEYLRSIPPACASMMCNFPPWFFAAKPVVCINYSLGQYGGACATQCLQPFCVELGMIPLQATVNIGHVDVSVSEDGTLRNTAFKGQIRRAFDQFLWYARAMKKAHSNRNDPFPVMNKGALLDEDKRANE